MTRPSPLYEHWQHNSTTAESTVVVPDGCRDLILHALPGQRPVWFVTALADSRYDVPGMVGERYWGYRMRPGVQVDETRLLATLNSPTVHHADDALPVLQDCMGLDPRVDEALEGLSASTSVAAASRELGLSERSLQRLVQAATGRSPTYWKCLARVRRAAAALPQASSLAACAAEHGYSDQAHMTREFGRWLGCAPGAVLASAPLLAAVVASGYGQADASENHRNAC